MHCSGNKPLATTLSCFFGVYMSIIHNGVFLTLIFNTFLSCLILIPVLKCHDFLELLIAFIVLFFFYNILLYCSHCPMLEGFPNIHIVQGVAKECPNT